MIGKLLHSLAIWLLSDIPGGLGQRLRAHYWRTRFAAFGRNVRIDEGVIFHNPSQIEVGDDVWIMAYAILTAPSPDQGKLAANKHSEGQTGGRLRIGNEVQVGLFSVLNGIGGLKIGNCVTMSARTTVYSATHLPRDPRDASRLVGGNGMVRSRPVFSRQRPVHIGDGAWLGLGATVICANVGKEAFVKSGAIVTVDLPDNMEYDQRGTIRPRHPVPE